MHGSVDTSDWTKGEAPDEHKSRVEWKGLVGCRPISKLDVTHLRCGQDGVACMKRYVLQAGGRHVLSRTACSSGGYILTGIWPAPPK